MPLQRRTFRQRRKDCLTLQRGDGGWAPSPYLPERRLRDKSGALGPVGTGALPVTDAAYRRGVEFLIKTREKDGIVGARSESRPEIPALFRERLPVPGHDQWISAAATARAVVVLAGYLGEGTNRLARR